MCAHHQCDTCARTILPHNMLHTPHSVLPLRGARSMLPWHSDRNRLKELRLKVSGPPGNKFQQKCPEHLARPLGLECQKSPQKSQKSLKLSQKFLFGTFSRLCRDVTGTSLALQAEEAGKTSWRLFRDTPRSWSLQSQA